MYFNKLPITKYNIKGTNSGEFVVVTNIMFRVGILEKLKNNIFTYYKVDVPDGTRPDVVAEKYYGDPGLHWVIFLANDIVNPLHQWVKNQRDFNNYIISKYGSIETAQTETAYYEKVIVRQNILENHIETIKLQVTEEVYNTLADSADYTAYTTNNSVTIHETITRNAVSFFDMEQDINEQRRSIKVIKPEYIPQIVTEFNKLTGIDLYRPGYRALNAA